jgi:hypothetical protein
MMVSKMKSGLLERVKISSNLDIGAGEHYEREGERRE